jgi:hypothetical protein
LLGLLIGGSRFGSCLRCIFLRILCRLLSLLRGRVSLIGPLRGCLSCGERLICLHSRRIGARLSPCKVISRRAACHERSSDNRRQKAALHQIHSHGICLSDFRGLSYPRRRRVAPPENDGNFYWAFKPSEQKAVKSMFALRLFRDFVAVAGAFGSAPRQRGDCTVAGAEGIEPSNAGIKIRCLTAWLRPMADAGFMPAGPRR